MLAELYSEWIKPARLEDWQCFCVVLYVISRFASAYDFYKQTNERSEWACFRQRVNKIVQANWPWNNLFIIYIKRFISEQNLKISMSLWFSFKGKQRAVKPPQFESCTEMASARRWSNKWTKTYYQDYLHCIANFCRALLIIFSKQFISSNTKRRKRMLNFVWNT